MLAHYGGVYIDLDNGCKRRLDPLLSFPAWLHLTEPTGISNDGMGATPQHPFFRYVVDQLQVYDRQWVLPYITVMSSTGPLFLSILWKKYMQLHFNKGVDWNGRIRVLTPDIYYLQEESFFDLRGAGSSWHEDDAKLISWMGQHWLPIVGFAIGAVTGLCMWWVYRRASRGKRRDYNSGENRRSVTMGQGRSWLPVWRSRRRAKGSYNYGLTGLRDTERFE